LDFFNAPAILLITRQQWAICQPTDAFDTLVLLVSCRGTNAEIWAKARSIFSIKGKKPNLTE
jgi:hypothetical protein